MKTRLTAYESFLDDHSMLVFVFHCPGGKKIKNKKNNRTTRDNNYSVIADEVLKGRHNSEASFFVLLSSEQRCQYIWYSAVSCSKPLCSVCAATCITSSVLEAKRVQRAALRGGRDQR